ncbi:TIGR02594 family protein [Aquisediminimonas sediminicola]|uniref:NlpC/P60 family protein n=1 Tax=Alteraquisediminimonas sediminicola TaxID=2676787 RepID=UPI001C8DFB69|nr:TIGR02594 family protein [Aquisediminimonas sediminicola]
MSAKNYALVAALQQALQQWGYDPGPIDGVNGVRTHQAIRAFQRDQRLSVDGVAGPMTLRRLRLHRGGTNIFGWLEEARAQKGVSELIGVGSNPVLIEWAKRLGLAYQDDRQPWCGLFVAHCIAQALPVEALPMRPLAARSWLQFGQPCDVQMGAVLIFWRGTPSGWAGHVGFCVGADRAAYHILVGNQGDAVSTARIARNRLLGARWPKSVALPVHPDPLLGNAAPVLSQNEA